VGHTGGGGVVVANVVLKQTGLENRVFFKKQFLVLRFLQEF